MRFKGARERSFDRCANDVRSLVERPTDEPEERLGCWFGRTLGRGGEGGSPFMGSWHLRARFHGACELDADSSWTEL